MLKLLKRREPKTFEIFLDLVHNIVIEKKDPEKIAQELIHYVYLIRASRGEDKKGNKVWEGLVI